MKQKYMKPQFRVELFTMSQSVALSCGYVDDNYLGSPTQADNTSCGWNTGYGEILWVSETTGCVNLVDKGYEHIEICYNNPDGFLTVFSS